MQQEITKLNIKEINKKRKECIRVVLTIVDDAMSYFHIANKTNKIISKQENQKKNKNQANKTKDEEEIIIKEKRTKKKQELAPTFSPSSKHPRATQSKKSPQKQAKEVNQSIRLKD